MFGPLLFSIYMPWLGSVIHKHGCSNHLCWWHSALLLIPTRWSDSSWPHCSLSDRHFWLDEGPSTSTFLCVLCLTVITDNSISMVLIYQPFEQQKTLKFSINSPEWRTAWVSPPMTCHSLLWRAQTVVLQLETVICAKYPSIFSVTQQHTRKHGLFTVIFLRCWGWNNLWVYDWSIQ